MADKLIQLKSVENNSTVQVYPYTKAKAIIFDNGKTLEEQITNHKHNLASASQDGLISKEDYLKLLNIEYNANKYYHPDTHDSSEVMHEGESLLTVIDEIMDKVNQSSAPSAPQEHTHHVDDIITTSTKMFISQAEKNLYADKYTRAESDNRYELKGQTNTTDNINVNSITIGNKFKLSLDENNNLKITNVITDMKIASLTEDGVLVVKEIQEF